MNTQVNLVVIPNDFLQKMESDINELKKLLRVKKEEEIDNQWIESVRIPKILGVSRKTWQSYRDKRIIPFSQLGSKIYVRRSDLKNFMESHLIGTRSEV